MKQPGVDYILPRVSLALLAVGAGTGEAGTVSDSPALLLPTLTSGELFLPVLGHAMQANHTTGFCSARQGRGRSGSLLQCGVGLHHTVKHPSLLQRARHIWSWGVLCVLHPLAFILVISLSACDLFIFRQSSAPLLPHLGTWGKPQTCP